MLMFNYNFEKIIIKDAQSPLQKDHHRMWMLVECQVVQVPVKIK